MTGGDKGEVRYCFKCGLEDHIAKDCKKSSPLKCIAHPEATSYENRACWISRKANNLPVTIVSRSLSKERERKTTPPIGGAGNGAPPQADRIQNAVSTEAEESVDTREVYSSDSSSSDNSKGESGEGGTHGGVETQSPDDPAPINPPTPPCPCEAQGALQVMIEDFEDIDLTSYFSDAESEDESENTQNTKGFDKLNKSNDDTLEVTKEDWEDMRSTANPTD